MESGVPHEQQIDVSVALIHWPVRDKTGKVIATSVTNFDIHDIARVSCTYGVNKYFIVHRQREQLMFVSRILNHWRVGYGSRFNASRGRALERVELCETLEDLIAGFSEPPIVVATAARDYPGVARVSFRELREEMMSRPGVPYLLLFGTGYGLTEDLLERCDRLLEPIRGPSLDQFRHLSVRSAVSICLDRLLATW
ncbi:MAG: RNA methyltransferase [Bdellovibrionales bacterium]|nr:RNA methyltransferase [Bdellovibrionales bacterium]